MAVMERGLREALGRIVGAVWAGPVALVSRVRRARMFHPRGLVVDASIEPVGSARYAELARRLRGHVLVRFSGAVSKRPRERFEVLGVAMRISDAPVTSPSPRPGDQDLTFATILSPLSMPISPFTTDARDFLANRYHAVAPFEGEGVGHCKIRLVPATAPVDRPHTNRAEKLEAAVRERNARFVLELRPTFTPDWLPIATLTLERFSDVDQEALRFDPFRDGRGLTPIGFVHAIRRAVYAASQAARPTGSTRRPRAADPRTDTSTSRHPTPALARTEGH